MLMVGLGFLIVIIAIVWGVAFQSGQQNRDNELGELGTWKQPESGTAVPDSGGSAKPPAQAPRKTEPAKPADAPAGTDPRVAGFNYLYLGTLTLKDASAGVDFLKRNGVQAFHVVDRSRGGGNNPPCRIYASQGFAGGPRFKETEKDRNDLIRRVEELGKKWQREDKGASDFRQPYWTLHKG